VCTWNAPGSETRGCIGLTRGTAQYWTERVLLARPVLEHGRYGAKEEPRNAARLPSPLSSLSLVRAHFRFFFSLLEEIRGLLLVLFLLTFRFFSLFICRSPLPASICTLISPIHLQLVGSLLFICSVSKSLMTVC
jgi:hypothetical protein